MKLNSPLVAGGDVHSSFADPFGAVPVVRLSADRAFYIADLETDDVWEVFMSSLVEP